METACAGLPSVSVWNWRGELRPGAPEVLCPELGASPSPQLNLPFEEQKRPVQPVQLGPGAAREWNQLGHPRPVLGQPGGSGPPRWKVGAGCRLGLLLQLECGQPCGGMRLLLPSRQGTAGREVQATLTFLTWALGTPVAGWCTCYLLA